MKMKKMYVYLTFNFYKAGTVKRGSYEYDEIDDERRIVPKRSR